MNNRFSTQVKVQKMGAFLSAEVMPNIGVFIGWGILAALFIPKGWFPNETLGSMVAPTMKYLMPVLIGYTGGYNVHSKRGGVIGAFATFGLILGADINMLAGAMFMGPFAAWCLKKSDNYFEDKVKPGLEMLVNNFTLGIIGLLLMVFGYFAIVQVIELLLSILNVGINFLLDRYLLPLLAIFVQPAKVLFLNNAVNHGIMIPLGLEQAAKMGKSILFMVEANNGAVLGIVLGFSLFGKGAARKSAPAAAFINFFGGIGEVVYPYVLSKPITVLAQISGSMISLIILQIFGGGTVGPISPGSFFALLAVSPKESIIVNAISYIAGALVSMLIVGLILKADKSEDDLQTSSDFSETLLTLNDDSYNKNVNEKLNRIQHIIFACDAGMGSSVMGVSIMKTKLQKAMLNVKVSHASVSNLSENAKNADLIVTSKPLEARVKDVLISSDNGVPVFSVENLLDNNAYDEIINYIKRTAHNI